MHWGPCKPRRIDGKEHSLSAIFLIYLFELRLITLQIFVMKGGMVELGLKMAALKKKMAALHIHCL